MTGDQTAQPPVRVGQYELFAAFARGGMASVHMARRTGPSGFAKVVAIKRLNPAVSDRDRHVRMLLEEARVTARVKSPYIVPVLDAVAEDDHVSIVMELVRGVTLAGLLVHVRSAGAAVPLPIATAILQDALKGLHAAHEATGPDGRPLVLVHRDVSPQNLIVGADGITRVLDFGIAKAMGRDSLTVTGEVKGKAGYLAPEQLQGGAYRQTDVFAAGIVLWEMLAGRKLRSGTMPEKLSAVSSETIPPIGAELGELGADIDRIIARATARESSQRFATAEAMATELAAVCPAASREDVIAFVERYGFAELEDLDRAARAADAWEMPVVEHAPMPDVPPRGRKRTVLVMVSAALVLGIAVAAFALNDRPSVAPSSVQPAVASVPESEPIFFTPPPATVTPSAEGAATADPARAARPNVAPPRRTAPAANCSPPYEIGADGLRHYKRECLK